MRNSPFSALPFALLVAACARTVNTPLQEIPQLTSLKVLMDNQATSFDGQYRKHKQATFTDAELAELSTTASRIQATSARTRTFANGRAEFDAYATHLGEQAAALGVAATAKDAAGVRAALVGMKGNCEGCHNKFD